MLIFFLQVISKFIQNAKEIEFDGVACQGKVVNYAISEHVENAGVHSGDATLLLPAQKLYAETINRIKKVAGAIALSLNITGPFNIQFLSRDNQVRVAIQFLLFEAQVLCLRPGESH